MKTLIRFSLGLMLVFSCTENKKEQKELPDYKYYNLEKVGWKSKVKTHKIDSTTFQASIVPIQYYIQRQNESYDLKTADSIYKQNERERIIEFIFEDDGGDDVLKSKFKKSDYQSNLKYISFNINKDFYLVTSSFDTIKCSGVINEGGTTSAPYTKLLLFFSNVDPDEKVQLVYNDVLFGKGRIKFSFKDPILKL